MSGIAKPNFHAGKAIILAQGERIATLESILAANDKALAEMRAENERLRKANSTRADYDLTCEECGRAHILDAVIPSEIWNQIAEPHNILCTLCIDKRLLAKGLAAEAEFYFCGQALLSKLYTAEAAEADLAQVRKALEQIRDGYGPDHLSKYARDVAARALSPETPDSKALAPHPRKEATE